MLGAAFLISLVYIITYITSKMKMENCMVHNYPSPAAPPQPLPPPPLPPQQQPVHHMYPVLDMPQQQWAMPIPNAPYASY